MDLKRACLEAVIGVLSASCGAGRRWPRPFDFENQRSYIFDNIVLAPGDVMNTTCEYSSPASFGKATSAEMCYFFSIHWPAGALTMPGTGTILHGANSCM